MLSVHRLDWLLRPSAAVGEAQRLRPRLEARRAGRGLRLPLLVARLLILAKVPARGARLRVGRRGTGAGQRDGAPGRRPSAGLRARKGPRKKARAAGGSGHAAAALAARWGRCRGPGRPGRCGQLTGVRALRAPRGLRYSNRPVALAHVVGILRIRVVLGLDVVDLVPEVRVGAGVGVGWWRG